MALIKLNYSHTESLISHLASPNVVKNAEADDI